MRPHRQLLEDSTPHLRLRASRPENCTGGATGLTTGRGPGAQVPRARHPDEGDPVTAAPYDNILQGIPHKSPWVRRLAAEIIRGRHVILHGNVHDVALWSHHFMRVPQVLQEVLEALGFDLIGRYDSSTDSASPALRAAGGLPTCSAIRSPRQRITRGTGCAVGVPPAEGGAGSGTRPGGLSSRADRASAARRQMADSLTTGAAGRSSVPAAPGSPCSDPARTRPVPGTRGVHHRLRRPAPAQSRRHRPGRARSPGHGEKGHDGIREPGTPRCATSSCW